MTIELSHPNDAIMTDPEPGLRRQVMSFTPGMMLVRARPASGKLIMCARRALPSGLTEVEAPHLMATLRADDLRFDRSEMAQLFAETGIDDTSLFRAARLTGGWPVLALFVQRLVRTLVRSLRGRA